MFKLKEKQYYSGVYYSFTKRGGLIIFLSKPVDLPPKQGWRSDMLTIINLSQDPPSTFQSGEALHTIMRATGEGDEEETQRKILKFKINVTFPFLLSSSDRRMASISFESFAIT